MCSLLFVSFLLRVLLPGPLNLNWLNGVVVICVLSILIGHTLFGIDALRYKLLPRWNAMPLLVGLTTPLLIMLSVIIESALRTDRYQIEIIIVSLYSSITGVWWILMGITMMGQRRAHEAPAA